MFYRLLESEGASHALDAWAAAEADHRQPRRREAVEEPARQVRRTFRENWQYLCESQSSQELIGVLERLAQRAFGVRAEGVALWALLWTGQELSTQAGAPPAHEMRLEGLDAAERKVVHQLCRLIGLHSESIKATADLKARCKAFKFGFRGGDDAPTLLALSTLGPICLGASVTRSSSFDIPYGAIECNRYI